MDTKEQIDEDHERRPLLKPIVDEVVIESSGKKDEVVKEYGGNEEKAKALKNVGASGAE